MKHVVFNLNDDYFALPVSQVREVLKLPKVKSIPQAPDFIDGMILIRGHSIAVMDLKKQLNLSQSANSKCRYVLVTVLKNILLGIIIDRVCDVAEIDIKKIDTANQIFAGLLTGKALKGVFYNEGRQISILNMDQIYDPDRLKDGLAFQTG